MNERIFHLDGALVDFDFVEFRHRFSSGVGMHECDLRSATALSVWAVGE